MDKTTLEIKDGIVVTLDYILKMDDGEEIERSEDDEPLVFLQGYDEIIPGLEKALYGLKIGDSKTVVVSPDEGYGDHDEDAIDTISFDDIPEDVQLQVGMVLEIYDEENDESIVGEIVELTADDVVVDFNHPLAGETLHFDVTVKDLRPATDEEIDHGHAHFDGMHEH